MFPYLLILSLSIVFDFSKIFPNYEGFLVIWIVLLIIKDILENFYNPVNYNRVVYNYKKLFSDFEEGKTSFFYTILFLNRVIFFPTFLIAYLICLVLNQWNMVELMPSLSKITAWSNTSLMLCVISAIFVVVKEKWDTRYIEVREANDFQYLNILMAIICSLIWSFIIFSQTSQLKILAYPISILAGIVIFLIWLKIIENNINEAS